MSLLRCPSRSVQDKKGFQKIFCGVKVTLIRSPIWPRGLPLCEDKKKGGLGIRSLAKLNRSFLCKWVWSFANEPNSLGKRVINRKFGEETRGWCSGLLKAVMAMGSGEKLGKNGSLFPLMDSFRLEMEDE